MTFNLQIIGVLKSRETQKAIRFFKERNIKAHFVNLLERALSKGELENIAHAIPFKELIDRNSKEYKKKGLEFMVYDIEEELLDNPLLLHIPIVRNGKNATAGYQPEIWKAWIKEAKDEA